MYRTLGELKTSIEKLIESQGENAGCAAFVFTKNDVITLDDEGQEVTYPEDFNEAVLEDVASNDYMYEQGFELIEDSIRFLKNRNQLNTIEAAK